MNTVSGPESSTSNPPAKMDSTRTLPAHPRSGFLQLLPSWPLLRAIKQTAAEVTVREPGSRLLSAPRPIASYASEHWEVAWISDAAYGRTPAGKRSKARQADAAEIDPEDRLVDAGWTKWTDFPDPVLHEKIAVSHLRVEIWEKRDPPIIAVAFGGTIFRNEKDWRANLRWFLPKAPDEYSAVVQTFAPDFVASLARRRESGRLSPLTRVISTGHSLGGGLAQQFAYCIQVDSGLPRVHKVYAFDPSPVTGYFSVEPRIRNANRRGLLIDRIYERGEVLAAVRSLMSFIRKPSKRNAQIRGVRYSLFRTWNPVAGHSMARMASTLDAYRTAPAGATARSCQEGGQ